MAHEKALLVFENTSHLKNDSKNARDLRKASYQSFLKSENVSCFTQNSKVKNLSKAITTFQNEGFSEFYFYFDDSLSKDYVRNVIPAIVSATKEKFLDLDFHYLKISTKNILRGV